MFMPVKLLSIGFAVLLVSVISGRSIICSSICRSITGGCFRGCIYSSIGNISFSGVVFVVFVELIVSQEDSVGPGQYVL